MPVVAVNPYQSNASIAGSGIPFVITPSDDDELPCVVRAIRAPNDGVITIVAADAVPAGDGVSVPSATVAHPVKEGELIYGRIKQVKVTGSEDQTGTIIGYV